MTSRRATLGFVALAVFVATIPLANWTTDRYGFRDVWLVGMIPAGTAWIAVSFVARDLGQYLVGKAWALAGIAAGSALSVVFADPGLAWASLVAFALSELVDMAIYTPMERRWFVGAVLVSSVVAAIIDSWIFLRIAFGEAAAADGWWRLAIAKVVIIAAVTPVAWWARRRVPAPA